MGATLGTRLMTWWKGRKVGQDDFGNRYYTERNGNRRWVIYAGEPDGSRVPPEWNAWLQHTTDTIPDADSARDYPWEGEHQPNLTGMPGAYHPPGSLLGEGRRPQATGDYEPWRPD